MRLPNRKRIAPADSLDPLGPPDRKWTARDNSPGSFNLLNCKRTALPDSPGPSGPPNHKLTTPRDSPGTTSTGIARTNESPLPVKKQRQFNASLLPNHVKWPTLDQLWDVVGDSKSQAFLRLQDTLKEYIFAARIFVDRINLIV